DLVAKCQPTVRVVHPPAGRASSRTPASSGDALRPGRIDEFPPLVLWGSGRKGVYLKRPARRRPPAKGRPPGSALRSTPSEPSRQGGRNAELVLPAAHAEAATSRAVGHRRVGTGAVQEPALAAVRPGAVDAGRRCGPAVAAGRESRRPHGVPRRGRAPRAGH